MNDWNVVVTNYESRFRQAKEFLETKETPFQCIY